jgi:hypothetical protein
MSSSFSWGILAEPFWASSPYNRATLAEETTSKRTAMMENGIWALRSALPLANLFDMPGLVSVIAVSHDSRDKKGES